MKLIWVLLFGLGQLVTQASAEEAVLIDAESLGQQQRVPVDGNLPSQIDTGEFSQANSESLSQADANRERILKGGKMSARQRTAMAKAQTSDTNKQLGEVFLAQNKAKQGVTSLPSGVQYKILRAGSGKTPTENSMVACRYRGTLIDGATFDKSEAQKTVDLSVSGLMPGLKEAVKLMSVGAKWQIVIPPQLAYGELGDRGVGPNAVLIYDMEIAGIK
jgi:FKBP-type peptidyl-prolyl cis-trans isomerase